MRGWWHNFELSCCGQERARRDHSKSNLRISSTKFVATSQEFNWLRSHDERRGLVHVETVVELVFDLSRHVQGVQTLSDGVDLFRVDVCLVAI